MFELVLGKGFGSPAKILSKGEEAAFVFDFN